METLRILFFVAVVAILYEETEGRVAIVKTEDTASLGVYDGEETDITNFPFTVSILVDSGEDDDQAYVGTIVSSKWVVTAANWTYRMSTAEVTVYAGSKSSGEGTAYSVLQIVKQPQFKTRNYNFQIACVKIDGEFQWSTKISKVLLPSLAIKANTNILVAGYGEDGNGDSLRFGSMKWMGSGFCSQTFRDWDIKWNKHLACAYNRSATTLCNGDVGTGFVKNNVLYGIFIGVVSEDEACSRNAYPVILANILPSASWIHNITGAEINPVL